MHTALLYRSKRLGLLVSALLVLVQAAAWAEGNVRKVGIVTTASVDAASRSPLFKQFTDTVLASAPSLDISFEWRSAEGKHRYPEIVTDLVQQRVDVIFTGPSPAAVVAQQVTTTVPVVFSIAANPVTLGLVKSLERPGGREDQANSGDRGGSA